MATATKKRKKEIGVGFKQTLLPAIIALVLFYIFYQMLTGERGIVTWFSLHEQVNKMTLENNALKEKIVRLEKKTSKLNSTTLDLDYLDEVIRRNMPVAGENEEIILIK
jgi:cell division protein FtsB